MASSMGGADQNAPEITLAHSSSDANTGTRVHRRLQRRTHHGPRHNAPHELLDAPSSAPRSAASSIYVGSYGHSPRRSRASLAGSLGTPLGSAPGTPRGGIHHNRLEDLLQNLNLDLESYGVEEFRDGFFDASFFKPPQTNHDDLMREAEYTLPAALRKKHPLSPRNFLPKQWHEIKGVFRNVSTTRAGIKLTKSFLAFFIAYIVCLIPVVRNWLGPYSYIMVLSTIINHPGRSVGSQIDGALLTIIGTASGLGWGAFALWVSDSTAAARRGYGGVIAAFFVVFMGTIAALRSYYIRMYQLVLAAGIAIIYTCLADTSQHIAWRKLYSYAIPWLFGQAICLLVCCTIFPDAGARPLAVSLHDAFAVMQKGLVFPQPDNVYLHRELSWTFVNLSQAHRDLVLDISVTRFKPTDVRSLRNLMHAVIRSMLSLKMETELFNISDEENSPKKLADEPLRTARLPPTAPLLNNDPQIPHSDEQSTRRQQMDDETVIGIDRTGKRQSPWKTDHRDHAIKLVADKLADPTAELLSSMRAALERCDAVLMDMSGYRMYLGPPKTVSSDIVGALTRIRKCIIKYDEHEEELMDNPTMPQTYANHPQIVELFLFVHPIRQASKSVEALLVKVMEMQQSHRGWRIYLPSYSFVKSLEHTNAQVRHDRGGVTAGFYFRSQSELAEIMRGMANVYKPLPHQFDDPHAAGDPELNVTRTETMGKYEQEEELGKGQKLFRYRAWLVLHRLQGFEMRFALKVVIVTTLLSVPGWLSQSRGWWTENESWWAVVSAWVMSHPRVGGNFQDLVTRAFFAVLGALWGGLAYRADSGNPYVMAVFAAVYMIPMIYRYTQSTHPRSGIMGCISFIVVSLGASTADGLPSVTHIAWTRGVALVVGVVAAVIVNWVLWPFVARHELRKALSAVLIYSSIIYRGVVARYVYYEKGEEPGPKDVERSEMLERRLREGFVRIRQLMALTRHEIRLRGAFNPLPYSALVDSCERFFEYLVSVRQSSVFFHPRYLSDNDQAAESLLTYRRDAVAAVLMNLYVLAGALRGSRKVPRYLPSAAAARKRLLDHFAHLESQYAQASEMATADNDDRERRRWSQIYSYSYNESLTGCVEQLEQLQRYTIEIVGELGFDAVEISS